MEEQKKSLESQDKPRVETMEKTLETLTEQG